MSAGWSLQFGANVLPEGGVRFRVWAPRARTLALEIADGAGRRLPMRRTDDGTFELVVPELGAGADYRYVIDGERPRPDPVSRWQPAGVHGPSRVVDPGAFAWTAADWHGLALEDHVIYELHTGTFTPAGTFDAIVPRLPQLRALGVTAIELLPVAQFPGERNWGYDGVDLYAPQSSYGGPAGLRRLIDACHQAGVAVVLDVVYNHVGPEGNYLGEYGPFFTDRYRSPWGEAINFDGPGSDGVRRFVIDNALYWLSEYRVDALRLDAVHAIYDFGARHVLAELTSAFHAEAARLGRRAWVIAESDLNDVRVIAPVERCGHGIDAQWSDDFHHALHAALTGDGHGYFMDFGRVHDIETAITRGFVYDGIFSRYRQRRHGSSAADRPGRQFVVCIQNHDQIANASAGERLAALVSPARQRVAATILLTAPNVPMLFMGEEYGETAPFDYFTSHTDPALAAAVRAGRSADYAAFAARRACPDPQAPATFERTRLDWSLREHPPHRHVLALYGDLLRLRRAHPALGDCRNDLTRATSCEAPRWLCVTRGDPAGDAVLVAASFGDEPAPIPLAESGVWDLALWTEDPAYGDPMGERRSARAPAGAGTARLFAGCHNHRPK